MKRPSPLSALGTLLTLAFFGCTSPGGPQDAVSAKPPCALVAPVNFQFITPAQLADGVEPTQAIVELFLQHHGVETQATSRDAFVEAWSNAGGANVRDGGSVEYGNTAREVLSGLSASDAGCVLVIPRVLYRSGEIRGTRAHWDGRSEQIIVEDVRKDWGAPQSSGPTEAVSVSIWVFDAEGQRVHEGYGGIELHWKIVGDMVGSYRFEYTMAMRDDLFANPKDTARGVTLAFDPYLSERRP